MGSPVPAASETSATEAAPAPRRLRGWLAPLFPPARCRPLTVKRAVVAVAVTVLGAGISLGRIAGPGPFNSIFAEDGSNFLTDALNLDLYHAIQRPINGYFALGPRLLADVAAFFPVAWAPAVMTAEAALVTAVMALAVYVCSGATFRSTPARLLVSVPVIAMPLAENLAATTSNSLATLQFLGVYTLFWLLVWTPATRYGRVGAVLAVGLIAASTLLGAVFLPLALLRLYVRRRLTELLMTGGLVLGTAAHLTALALGRTARPAFMAPRLDPVWALDGLARWALPSEVLGYRGLGPPATLATWRWPAVLAWVLVAAAVVATWRGLTRPNWVMVLLAGGSSLVLLLVQVMSSGITEERYLIAPGMLMIVATVALLQPGEHRYGRIPFAAYAVLLTVVVLVNYRGTDSFRARGPAWDDQLRPAVARCNAEPRLRTERVPTGFTGPWYVDVPCRRIRL